ncbi:hypothetical protein ABFS82_14G194700 [Erythranthe guttata]|uniref:rho GTPase-activating protein 2-like n=1 Tax=Erythranthe guttata TaxID=4155 RepID=UPI00064DE2B1|nr:PREDICTED: rho GTPase-activating protein 2-like [Erythranthe guttata]|eukprot:XP_012836626.1 PREDICTED: rho GTPase-activating protein 2-like [Erythranthe guttata]
MSGMFMVTKGGGCAGKNKKKKNKKNKSKCCDDDEEQKQISSLVEVCVSAFRKSTCRQDQVVISTVNLNHIDNMEIGWPTNVQHLTHVTFDRFHGFLGLPLEFQLQIPCKPPSASVSVCGVSAESMQWSYDTRSNSVPTILLLMQQKLYALGGLMTEGIFRINPENSREEHVRDQLNRGVVPEDIDIHCLAGLIKAWFRELPCGVLDGLSKEQVLQCNNEDEFVELVKQLKPTDSCLLEWAVDLMADVVEQEEHNKMNARNIAMVFAPNMTQMLDPLTALMHAVQVMNLLKALISKKLREREESAEGVSSPTVSSRFSFRQKEYYGQHDIDDDDASCESRGTASDDEDVESLSEVEECFLRQMDESENAKQDGFRRQMERILCRDNESPVIYSYNNIFEDSESRKIQCSIGEKE